MLRTLLDGRALYDSSRYRGIGTYVREVLAALGRRPDVETFALVSAGAPTPPGVHRVPVSRPLANRRFGDLEHALRLPRDIMHAPPVDVFHGTGQEPPSRCSIPWIQTIHSVIPLQVEHPELAAERRRWSRLAPHMRRATRLLAVSSDTADAAATLLDIPRSRFTVAPLGVNEAFRPGRPRQDSAPYILYVGEYGPWKGFSEAFALSDRLAESGYPHRLRMAGRVAPWRAPAVTALLSRARHPSRVDLIGYQSPTDLVSLYRGAGALVVTSRCEGFGLPAVEAMASGCPVVGFANSALREVIGPGGIQVPDGDVDAMFEVLRVLLDDEAARAAAVEAGLAWSRQFTWSACAAVHASVYAEVAR